MKTIEITDNKNKILLKTKGDQIIVKRYPNMDESTKSTIADFYTEFTGTDRTEILDFLNYKHEELEFCS